MTEFCTTLETVDGLEVILIKPYGKLSDEVYDRLKEYFEVMGGHWREKLGGFVFYTDHFRRDDKAKKREHTQFFYTPPSVSSYLVDLSGLSKLESIAHAADIHILEPSAGRGDLIQALPPELIDSVTAVEPDKFSWGCYHRLTSICHNVHNCTFEEYYSKAREDGMTFTHVLMNPPYSEGRDIKHVRMAYDLLAPGGRLVSVISENSCYWKNDLSKSFRKWLGEVNAQVVSLPTGSFKASGTMIDTMTLLVDKK